MPDPMSLEETIAQLAALCGAYKGEQGDESLALDRSTLHWLTTLKAENEREEAARLAVERICSDLERRCSTLSAAGMLLRNEHTKLRSQLAKLVDEVTHVISGGDEPGDKCTECGCAGIGMLRDARRDSIALGGFFCYGTAAQADFAPPKSAEPKAEAIDEWTDELIATHKTLCFEQGIANHWLRRAIAGIERRNARITQLEADERFNLGRIRELEAELGTLADVSKSTIASLERQLAEARGKP